METEGWKKVLLWGSFIFFLGSLLLRQESAITQDLGRHLRLGEMIVKGGQERNCALFTNCLTYTYPDYPFVNHHWGSEVVFYLIHRLSGFGGLIIFKTLVLGGAFLIIVLHTSAVQKTQNTQKARTSENQRARVSDSPALRFSHTSGSPSFPSVLKLSVAIILTFLSINMMADRLTTRPEIFGYLFFSLVFFILSRSYIKCSTTFYILPIIMLLWVNLHISFIFGLILIYLWSFSALIKKGPALRSKAGPYQTIDAPSIPTILTIPAISTLVILLNPSGLRGALMPLSILKDYGYTIVENMTPFFLSAFKPQPEYWIYAIFLTITTILLIISPKKPPLFSVLTFYIFSILPLIAVRHLPFFALIIPTVLTSLIASVLKGPALLRKAEPYYAHIPIVTAGFLFLTAFTNPIPLAYGKLPPIGLTIDPRHNSAIEFVKQNNLQGPMWNNYDIGSFLEWATPEHKTFVDGRPEAFPVGFFRQTYIPMQENKEVWDRVVADYDIQWIFAALTDSTPWFTKWWKMIQSHQDWQIVYIDNFSAVLVKIDGKNNLVEPQGKAKLLKVSNFN